jgi:1-phosphofructokinase family hexose kinase
VASRFLTVTLNPAVDKTLRVDRNPPQETIRATEAIDLAGGKGVNVARALMALGAGARAFTPLGGHPGEHLAALARAEGIEVAAVPVGGSTRNAITVRDAETGQYWHYLEPGPVFTDVEMERIRAGFLEALQGCHTVAISGSLPCAEAAPVLPWMVRAAKERGLRVALDSFGAAVRPALEAGPWLAKPNVEELEATLGESLLTPADRWEALERLAEWGVSIAILSIGARGAMALAEGRRFRIHAPEVAEVNDLGGGDSMVAGVCWAAQMGYNVPELLAWGAACGAANAAVWDPGGISRVEVERLLPRVRVEPV